MPPRIADVNDRQNTHGRHLPKKLIGGRHVLGHAEIDTDHFAIADCWLQATQCEPIVLPFQIARLRKLMRNHFDREASLVEATGTAFCRCHRQEHDGLLELCGDAYALSYQNVRKSRSLLQNELPRLVRDHIISMDQIAILIINLAAEDSALATGH
jgi:hemerythrin